MLPVPHTDELQTPRPKRELIVAVDVAIIAGERLGVGPGAELA